jgi:uncharacterized radical SAM superfamily protein
MPDVSSPKKLKEYSIKHMNNEGVGLLISGGSTSEGKVPLKPFLDSIKWIKENTNLILNLHTGILNKKEAEAIASTEIDVVSVDLVGSEDTLKSVYGLDISLDEYEDTLGNLIDGGAKVAPHICVGLHYGSIKGEIKALELAASIKPETVILISLMPTVNTPMAKVKPPTIEMITELIYEAKKVCKDSEVGLGCMRSRGYKTELEWAAIEAGASRITLASRSIEQKAIEFGFHVVKLESCCSVPRKYDSVFLGFKC